MCLPALSRIFEWGRPGFRQARELNADGAIVSDDSFVRSRGGGGCGSESEVRSGGQKSDF